MIIVQKILNLDYNYMLGKHEFFNAVDTKGLFKSLEKIYVSVEKN